MNKDLRPLDVLYIYFGKKVQKVMVTKPEDAFGFVEVQLLDNDNRIALLQLTQEEIEACRVT